MRRNPTPALLFALALAETGCGGSPALRGQLAGLTELTEHAVARGAMRCAPRQLAIAHAELHFAALELDQGFASKAATHLAVAELNARAANNLSPVGGCDAQAATGPLAAAPGDSDGDGVADDLDRCPAQPENYDGFEDADGCPDQGDTDGDSVLDVVDACVLQPEDGDGFQDDDGCPDPDHDGDGVLDTIDRCTAEPEDPDGYQDDDGCPDLDNDGDGVTDRLDACPNTPGQDARPPLGCPTEPDTTEPDTNGSTAPAP